MSTEFIPFTSYLLAAMAVAAVLVVGILGALSAQAAAQVVTDWRTRSAKTAELRAAWGRVSHQG